MRRVVQRQAISGSGLFNAYSLITFEKSRKALVLHYLILFKLVEDGTSLWFACSLKTEWEDDLSDLKT